MASLHSACYLFGFVRQGLMKPSLNPNSTKDDFEHLSNSNPIFNIPTSSDTDIRCKKATLCLAFLCSS